MAVPWAAILLLAVAIERLFPRPASWQLSALAAPLGVLGRRLHNPKHSIKRQQFTGAFILIALWLPSALLVALLRHLAPSGELFDLLFLVLLLEGRSLSDMASIGQSLKNPALLPLARLNARQFIRRDCSEFDAPALAKALTESLTLRLVGQWAGPMLGYALLGIQGALLWRFIQVVNLALNLKLKRFKYFGSYPCAFYLALCTPTVFMLSLPLQLAHLRQLGAAMRSGVNWPNPANGVLLALLAEEFKLRFGGARDYATQARWPLIGSGQTPHSDSPKQVLSFFTYVVFFWLIGALPFSLAWTYLL
ncbi:MAG: cobalamin biosynthesis protein [Aeromonas sp.]